MTQTNEEALPPLVATGIPGLDDVLAGGFTPNRIYLIEGNPGAGKTTLALRWLLEGERLGEKCIYVTLSETKAELASVARSHGWSLDGISILELVAPESELEPDNQLAMFQPSEVELGVTTKAILAEVERTKPRRVVIDSLSEMRLLAQSPLRYRRQILALKQYFIGRECTVFLLDDLTSETEDLQLQSIAHGVVSLEQLSPEYGAERRRLRVTKLRGQKYRGGYHDFVIEKGGLAVFPRLIAGEYARGQKRGLLKADNDQLDALLGGGLPYGTSAVLLGPAGSGKSTLAIQYARAAAGRSEHAAIFAFDERMETLVERTTGLGMDITKYLESGHIEIRPIDTAELSPGEFAHHIRRAAEGEAGRPGAKVIVIDSLNGYLNAMPEERFLTAQLHELLTYLGHMGVVTFLVVAQHGLVGNMESPIDTTYLADTVILFRYFEAMGEVRQAITFLNRAAEELTRWDANTARGRPLEEVFRIVNESSRQPVENPARRALDDGKVVGLANHTVLLARDGSEWPLDDSAAPIRDESGAVAGAVLVFREISARKAAEKQIRQAAEANAKFHAMFEQGAQFAGLLTLQGTLVEANRLCLNACGFTRDDVVGKPFWECGWWNRSESLAGLVRSACAQAAEGCIFRTETNYFVADGSERFVDLTLAPVTDDAGRILFLTATGTDITERRAMEKALREADRKKDDFIALLAHELRNPLAPIRNGLQVLRLARGDAGALERARDMMDRQLSHMVRLIDDLLDISRISRNKMELRRSRVLLADVVASAVETARPVIDAEGHELNVSLPQRPLFLDADLTRLAQVFSNLLTNSAKYTGRGGQLWLTAVRRGEEVVVTVRDTGIGIPPESLGKIFDMFSQVDRPTERSTGGLGIGLALVKGLVEMHGGTVTAASQGEGKGSTFTVTLPVMADKQEAAAVPVSDKGPAAPGQRILVVDDNRDGAESLAMMLGLLGNEVRTANDGLQAVEEAEAFRPEVILMDVGMPRLNGLDATRRIRGQAWGKAVTVIALTGWGQESDKERSHEAGCDGHLVKPVSLPDLQKLLVELR